MHPERFREPHLWLMGDVKWMAQLRCGNVLGLWKQADQSSWQIRGIISSIHGIHYYQGHMHFWRWRNLSIIRHTSAYPHFITTLIIHPHETKSTIRKNNNNIFIMFFIISYMNSNMNIRNITFFLIQNIEI